MTAPGSDSPFFPSDFPDPRCLVDLSHGLDSEALSWPGEEGFSTRIETDAPMPPDHRVRSNRFTTGEHVGTHVDAPRHMMPDGLTLDQVPLNRWMGRGVRIDVSRARGGERDFQIPVPLLLRWENIHGPIPEGAIVLLHTGYGSLWGNPEAYLGTANREPAGEEELHFPGLLPEAAHWLVAKCRIKAVGIDTHGIDCGRSQTFESHKILLSRNIPILENLANLDRLPDSGFTVLALPLPIRGGTGAPARVVAILDQPPGSEP